MSNCRDPDQHGVAQYCVPAVLYVAQQQWVEPGRLQGLTGYFKLVLFMTVLWLIMMMLMMIDMMMVIVKYNGNGDAGGDDYDDNDLWMIVMLIVCW